MAVRDVSKASYLLNFDDFDLELEQLDPIQSREAPEDVSDHTVLNEELAQSIEEVAKTILEADNKILLSKGESLQVEPSAMLASQNLTVETGFSNSLVSVFKRFILGGESFFLNTYTAKQEDGWITLEGLPGQISSYALKPGELLTLGRGAYVASQDVDVTIKYKGWSDWSSGIIGIAEIEARACEKTGKVFFSATQGIIKEIQKKAEENPICVDNNNVIAYTGGIKASVKMFGNDWMSSLFSGEGLVYEFSGEGSVFVGSGVTAARDNLLESAMKTASQYSTTILSTIPVAILGYMASRSPHVARVKTAFESFFSSFHI